LLPQQRLLLQDEHAGDNAWNVNLDNELEMCDYAGALHSRLHRRTTLAASQL
jgi:hypothetical protein